MGKKILIVEDDMALTRVLKVVLEEKGFKVLSSLDAYGGTHLAHKEKPDVIVLDMMMPAGGGLSVLRNLKESIHTNHIPIIVTTGTSDIELEKEARNLGVRDYIYKPYSQKDLVDKISSILS